MSYVVVDLEWNQAMRSDSPIFNRLPIHLRGEIIEIGAVRLNDDFSLGEEFTVDVKPVYFRQMHYKVKKLTGFDKDRLALGVSFSDACEQFREFCGDDVTFLTWGCDDQAIFEQNIIIHDLDWDWIKGWVNLQTIFNIQTGGDRNQKSLAAGMEYYAIEQTRVAHDALGDAYNTALVSTHLNLEEGLRTYSNANQILAARIMAGNASEESSGPATALCHDFFEGYESKAAAFADDRVSCVPCPACSSGMEGIKWINQGDGRYMNLYSCPEHGKFLVRVRFHKDALDTNLCANRLIYEADDEMLSFYKEKSAQSRRRGRGHYVKKKIGGFLK